jgi:hypothetical protein
MRVTCPANLTVLFKSFEAEFLVPLDFLPANTSHFISPHHYVQNGSRVHPASYQMDSRSSFPGGKAAGA